MYEHMTYEAILNRCLSRVTGDVDKREGSIIYDALAPSAAELAQLYIELDTLIDRAFPDTAQGDDLTKKAMERGLFRKESTKAVRLALLGDTGVSGGAIETGRRFSDGSVNYAVTARLSAGRYSMEAETAGSAGNLYSGRLFSLDYIQGLASAELTDILIPGEDEESDDALRARYYETLNEQAFGGNAADYRNKARQMRGVGGSKVSAAWNGPGTVRLIIADSNFKTPSAELVSEVQQAFDPIQNRAMGQGLAPVGHCVTVSPVKGFTVNVSFSLTFADGISWDNVRDEVEAAIKLHFESIARSWSGEGDAFVRITLLEAAIMTVGGIVDIKNTRLNGGASSIKLAVDEIPALGTVTNGAA